MEGQDSDRLQFQNINNASGSNTSYVPITYYSDDIYPFEDVSPFLRLTAMYLDKYFVPTVFTLGVLLNILVFCVVLRTELKRVSPFLYTASFAVVDTAYLVQKMVLWASSRLYNIYAVAGICQLTYYCHFLTTFLDWWLMVMMLSERIFLLFYQKSAQKLCSAFRTKCNIVTVSIFSIVSHLYLTWTSAVIKMHNVDRCIIIPENTEDIVILRKVDTVFSFMVPSVCLLLMLVVCGIKHLSDILKQTDRATHNNPSRQNSKRRNKSLSNDNRKFEYLKDFDGAIFTRKTRVFTMCYVTVIMFLLLCIPHESLKAQIIIMNKASFREQIWLQILSELSAFSFACKGLVYITCLREFRIATWKLIKTIAQPKCCKSSYSKHQITDV